ncbi:hypothetical protein BE20_37340 [Sorangium cellulosum]|uniref:hypothetical protein n=1 Tax=Sorangium sp. So ce185 TaxID=3133287 RepID=UPI00077964BD|nr:hypothetical protein BE20_37340 [Sorangium cellulosum]
MKITKLSGVFALLLIALAAPGCGKEEQPAEANATVEVTATAESAIGEGAYVEEHESGKAAFNVAADGNVKAVVSGPDGKPIREDVSGTLLWKDASGEKTLPLTLDAKTGLLVAAGPKLEADLTEIGYTLNVAGKPWNGTLHVPAGGTAELYANAKGSADLGLPEGKLGPHGGRIEIVGDDRLELLVDEVTGEVRVYVLDADLKPIDIGERKVTLGVVAEAPQVVVLAPVAATAGVAAGAYLTGKLALAADPLKVTVAVRNAGRSAVALCGYRAGAAFAVHAHAPRVKVRMKTDWHAHAHAHADLKAKADLDPKVHVHTGAGAKAHAKANVNVKAPSVRVTPPSVNVQIKAPSISIPKPSFKASASARASAGAKVGTR